jgi:hypothetical protein
MWARNCGIVNVHMSRAPWLLMPSPLLRAPRFWGFWCGVK